MLLLRLPVLSVVLLLLLTAGRCAAAALSRGSGGRLDGRLDSRSAAELLGQYARTRNETPGGLTRVRAPGRGSRTHQGLEAHRRESNQKEKFIIHLTGPLYFNPKCRKQFYRLYHSTRDCTVPAYYRRCARLLTQLAKSPRCAER